MRPVDDLARLLRTPTPARTLQGRVVAVVDATHARVDVGDRIVSAFTGVPVRVGSDVRLLVSGGVCEVLAVAPLAWTAITPAGSWVNFGAGTAPAAYRHIGDEVHLRGTVKDGTGVVYTMPAGLRPSGIVQFACVAGPGGARIDVGPDGAVTVQGYYGGGNNTMVSLSTIRYSTS